MPRYSLDTCPTINKNNNDKKVGYFKLKPGEKAIVRFAYKTAKEIEIATVHEVKVKDKFRTVLCIRDANDPLDACPLCANGTDIKSRAYVKLLRYEVDTQGKVTNVVAEVANWPKKYATTLSNRNNEYGDLQDSLFTVTRTGSGKDTTYDIQYANPVKYNEANGFVKDFSDFEGFELAHHSYIERSKEDIEEFLQSGEFPMPKKNNQNTQGQGDVAETVTTPVGGAVPNNYQQTPNVIANPQPAVFEQQRPMRNTYTENINVNPQQAGTVGINQAGPMYSGVVSPNQPQQKMPSDTSSNDVIQRPRRTYDIR